EGYSRFLFLLLVLLSEVEQALAPRGSVLIKRAAVPVVGASLERCIEDTAAGSANLGIVGADLHLHLLNCFDRGYNDGAIPHICNRHPFDQIIVTAAGPATQAEQR